MVIKLWWTAAAPRQYSAVKTQVIHITIKFWCSATGPRHSWFNMVQIFTGHTSRYIYTDPKNPFHPGEILLEEFLEPKGATQAAFAEKIGWTKTRLNELIKGKRGITAAAALDLADALGTSPKLWMNLQATYDLDKAARVRRVA